MEIALNRGAQPHAVLFPFAVLGHVRPLLQLARRLANEFGFKVTFVTTSYIYRKMDLAHASRDGDDVQFLDLQEGFPDSYYSIATMKILIKAGTTLGPKLIDCLQKTLNTSPVTCVISDLVFDEAHRAALHHNIPSIAFSSQCAMATVAKYYGLRLVNQGLVPVPKNATQEYFSKTVTNIPGLHPMQLKDYYSGLLVTDTTDSFFQFVVGEHSSTLHQRDWILSNSVLELETSVIEGFEQDSKLRVTTIGPLSLLAGEENAYWPEQASALEWLDRQAPSSVVYVSFGSLATVPVEVVEEIVLGLEGSNVPFLMVIRVDGVVEEGSGWNRAVMIEEIEKRTRDRGLFVSWAPQQKVLRHPAVAGFLSHCGWNSFLESLSAGVPILCHPFFLDQPMIARYIVSVWEMGLELEKRADGSVARDEVAKKLKALAAKESVVRTNAKEWQRVATEAVKGGGSSHSNLVAFVDDMYRRAAGAST